MDISYEQFRGIREANKHNAGFHRPSAKREFVKALVMHEPVEFPLKEGQRADNARTGIYEYAKEAGIHIHTTVTDNRLFICRVNGGEAG